MIRVRQPIRDSRGGGPSSRSVATPVGSPRRRTCRPCRPAPPCLPPHNRLAPSLHGQRTRTAERACEWAELGERRDAHGLPAAARRLNAARRRCSRLLRCCPGDCPQLGPTSIAAAVVRLQRSRLLGRREAQRAKVHRLVEPQLVADGRPRGPVRVRGVVGALVKVARPRARAWRAERAVQLLEQCKRHGEVEPPARRLRVRRRLAPVGARIEGRVDAEAADEGRRDLAALARLLLPAADEHRPEAVELKVGVQVGAHLQEELDARVREDGAVGLRVPPEHVWLLDVEAHVELLRVVLRARDHSRPVVGAAPSVEVRHRRRVDALPAFVGAGNRRRRRPAHGVRRPCRRRAVGRAGTGGAGVAARRLGRFWLWRLRRR
mmetsp:Transcript_73669/g.195996  ORF Transcript_73669/g.195996 Transcript_73669/m.195996 type:complete len:378 (-) Transcript_73669:506-1639(-)